MKIKGNVGIETTNPLEDLHIKSTIGNAALIIDGASGSGTNGEILLCTA